ncbi:hypothetical protein RRG08_051048 [Elysia crispata]|uniref:Uncharacterized protein n=1 Tax=Elysia crispata TaxID=231223 RepID=A0AAE0Z5A0_9GAST|nr:hypothetical protein RRG08_051048 [Elysia crispata]
MGASTHATPSILWGRSIFPRFGRGYCNLAVTQSAPAGYKNGGELSSPARCDLRLWDLSADQPMRGLSRPCRQRNGALGDTCAFPGRNLLKDFLVCQEFPEARASSASSCLGSAPACHTPVFRYWMISISGSSSTAGYPSKSCGSMQCTELLSSAERIPNRSEEFAPDKTNRTKLKMTCRPLNREFEQVLRRRLPVI